MVGKVLSIWVIFPPMEASLSTRTTSWPPSAISSAACMPAMPPPMTMAFLVMGTVAICKGLLRKALDTAILTSCSALAVASALSWCTPVVLLTDIDHFHHKIDSIRRLRCLAEGFFMHARRAGSNHYLFQLLFLDGIADEFSCPGSEHMYL